LLEKNNMNKKQELEKVAKAILQNAVRNMVKRSFRDDGLNKKIRQNAELQNSKRLSGTQKALLSRAFQSPQGYPTRRDPVLTYKINSLRAFQAQQGHPIRLRHNPQTGYWEQLAPSDPKLISQQSIVAPGSERPNMHSLGTVDANPDMRDLRPLQVQMYNPAVPSPLNRNLNPVDVEQLARTNSTERLRDVTKDGTTVLPPSSPETPSEGPSSPRKRPVHSLGSPLAWRKRVYKKNRERPFSFGSPPKDTPPPAASGGLLSSPLFLSLLMGGGLGALAGNVGSRVLDDDSDEKELKRRRRLATLGGLGAGAGLAYMMSGRGGSQGQQPPAAPKEVQASYNPRRQPSRADFVFMTSRALAAAKVVNNLRRLGKQI
jgi:hypothetical protein